MSIAVALHHVTRYKYDQPVSLGPQVIRLRPAPHSRTRISSYSLKVLPETHFVNWQQDPQGNWLARFVFPEPTREFKIEVGFIANMAVVNTFDFFVEPYAETFPFLYPPDIADELAPYLKTEPVTPSLAQYLASIPREPTNTVNFLVDLNAKLRDRVSYVIRMEPGIQTPEETLQSGAGSCRDSAWLLIQALAISDWPRGLSRAISFNCVPTSTRYRDRAKSRLISRICMHGRKSICRALDGLDST